MSSQFRTPSKSRISGQLSGSGTIVSETPLLKDEFAGRRQQIHFLTFCQAFLQRDDFDLLDGPANTLYLTSDFRDHCARFAQSVASSSTEVTSTYHALADLLNLIVDWTRHNYAAPGALPLRFTCQSSRQPVSGSASRRKPDLVGISGTNPMDTFYSWDTVTVVCEYKLAPPRVGSSRSSTPLHSSTQAEPMPTVSHPTDGQQASQLSDTLPLSLYMNESDIQLGRYMLEMRSAQPSRAAGYGVQFMKDHASFWYSDADSTITSAPVPIDSPSFVRAIMHLARAAAVDIGYLADFLDDEQRTTTQIVDSHLVIQHIKYQITEVISLARAVHGRCTCVLAAKNPEGVEVAIKLSWQVITRLNEVSMLQLARSRDVKSVVDVLGWVDLRKLSDGRRARLPPAVQLKLQLEDRWLRVIILPLCMPLYKVLDPKDFLKACISLLKAIHELYAKAKILHRDVSVNNLMVKKDNPAEGVLIDLDLGHTVPEDGKQPGPTSLHRTGTLPFMALDLLHGQSEYPHYHRHDLESFVYVLVWIVGKYEAGVEVDRNLFRSWCEGNWSTIASDKLAFLEFSGHYASFKPTSTFHVLEMLIYELRNTIGEAHANFRKARARPKIHSTRPNLAQSSDEGYVDSPSSGKRRRAATPMDQPTVYPEELPDLTYSTLRGLLEEALDELS
ncbi:unnamed protein product [Rhizoctonia solani]|uniref:Protein kinase domain-containing protein n=1 Tax=Rhizoctonia solani TaxID=456999 RepID=A0A8H2XYX1_9AGAM|nr:unnamed protein product [Rhizoctonia solani]